MPLADHAAPFGRGGLRPHPNEAQAGSGHQCRADIGRHLSQSFDFLSGVL